MTTSRTKQLSAATIASMLAYSASQAADPGAPEANGLIPASPVVLVNNTTEGFLNNGAPGPVGVAVTKSGNTVVAYSDWVPAATLPQLSQGQWTILGPAGEYLSPAITLTPTAASTPVLEQLGVALLGTPIPPDPFSTRGYTFNSAAGHWTIPLVLGSPKVKPNLFGDGFIFGGWASYTIGTEALELLDTWQDATPGLGFNDFPVAQMFDSTGTKLSAVVSGASAADAEPAEPIRGSDVEILSNGNILILGESRQKSDWQTRFGGTVPDKEHTVFRIVKPDGTEVKAYSVVTADLNTPNNSSSWHGAAVIKGCFAIRFDDGGAKMRIFSNDGAPLTGNISIAAVAGAPAASGGRGDSVGFHGNGSDSFLLVTGNETVNPRQVQVTVFNADGSLRYSRDASDDIPSTGGVDRLDGAIDDSGRVVVVYTDGSGVLARVFARNGSPLGGTCLVAPAGGQRRPRASLQGNRFAAAWETPGVGIEARIFTLNTVSTLEQNGLAATSGTFFVNPANSVANPNGINNGKTESQGVAIAANGNVLIGWEDDGAELNDLEAAWKLYDGSGALLTPLTTITSLRPELPGSLEATFRALFRTDLSPTPANTAWGPKIKANVFGNGIGMGAIAFATGLEIPELAEINVDVNGGGDFPIVQLLNNDGTPTGIPLSGYNDADAEPAGDVRIGDWEYLSDGNILIVGESRQSSDWIDRFGGPSARTHVAFRILKPDGTVVKELTAGSSDLISTGGNEMWHGAGVIRGAFALRFTEGGAKIRIFSNDGTPLTDNIDLTTMAGGIGIAGRGDSSGFHGNGEDAFLNVTDANDPADGNKKKAHVMVINADGSLRWARFASDDIPLVASSRVDGAIDPLGRVIAVYADAGPSATAGVAVPLARMFHPDGSAASSTFGVSEIDSPALAQLGSQHPRVAWRGTKIAVTWQSRSAENGVLTIAGRILAVPALDTPEENGMIPQSPTFFVNPANSVANPNGINNGKTESQGVAIAANGNVLIGWEDDGAELNDLEAAWKLYDGSGTLLTTLTTITSLRPELPGSLEATFRALFRSDLSPTPANTAWGPKIKANVFGNGIGMGAIAFATGLEIPELAEINVDVNGGGDFPIVQLLNNDGTPTGIPLSGYNDADAEPAGDVRIGDWEYLSDGNILIVAESRQSSDWVDRFGGPSARTHVTFRILKPDGTVVKELTAASSDLISTGGNEMWHGAGVIQGAFALRFTEGGAKIRIFSNDGTPLTENIDLTTMAGGIGIAGRGDSSGFHGNGLDAFVNVTDANDPADGNKRKAHVMVINADGTLRWARFASDDIPLAGASRVDGAIDPSGRVIAVYSDAGPSTTAGVAVPLARIFNANGSAASSTFGVSEIDSPALAQLGTQHPRVAWRGNKVAVAWQSRSAENGVLTIAGRIFAVHGPSVTLTTVSASIQAGQLTLTWPGGGQLESSPNPGGPWTAVAGATSPYTAAPNQPKLFYRVR